jgi:hypothetical protein
VREVEAPTFSDFRLIDGGKVVSPTRRLTPFIIVQQSSHIRLEHLIVTSTASSYGVHTDITYYIQVQYIRCSGKCRTFMETPYSALNHYITLPFV